MNLISPNSSRSEVVKLSIILVTLTWIIIFWNWTWRWDQQIYDAQSRLLPHQVSDDIVIIAIDETSLKKIGRWPWSRRVHAQLVNILTHHQAKAVILDIIFAEPNTHDPSGDQLLVNALLNNGKVVLPVLLEQTRLRGQLVETLPLPGLTQASAALGHVHVELDSDGIARRTFLYEGLGESRWPHIALATLQLLETTGPITPQPKASASRHANDTHWLWVRDQHFLIPFIGPPGSFKTISYTTILNGQVPPQSLKNKIVLVGVTATGLGDALPTPLSGLAQPMPGVEINANIIQALQTNMEIHRVSPIWQYILTALYVLIPILLFPYLSPRASLLLVLFSSLLLFLTTLLSLRWLQIWIPVSAPIIGLLLTYPLWTWRRLEFAVKFLNNELERLATERKDFQDDHSLDPDDAIAFIQSIVPLRGLILYDASNTERLKLGDIQANAPNLLLGNNWSCTKTNHYWRSVTLDHENFNIIVNWNHQENPPSESETQFLLTYILRTLTSRLVEPKTTVELIESRIRKIKIATDNLSQIRRIVSNSLEQMADGVLVINSVGQIILANRQAGKFITGDENTTISHQAVLPLLNSLTITNNDSWLTIIRAALIDHQTQQRQARSPFHLDLLVSVTPLISMQKPTSGLIINFSEITELKNAERKRNEVLEFLSHDLRSPLVSIIALAEHAKSTDNGKHQHLMCNIENYTNRAIQLAEDFVHLSRVESNDEIKFSAIDIECIASNAIDAVWHQAKTKQISIKQQYNGHTWICGNGSILERAIVNLLNNAIKYSTPQTSISLSINGDDSTVRCCIEDNGIGIPEEVAETIFDRFSRVDHKNVAQQPGIGLGLAFVKAAVERHHGSVAVKSTLNEGSCFCITLPSEHSLDLG
ncbi:MAG: CHASE2 domain-containing protein [Gammaproteobacteria bacterium]|nr:CHASE2 domain-containing protein [Gammaproteobacteria bacterium]